MEEVKIEELKVAPYDHKPYIRDPKSGRIVDYRAYEVHYSRAGMFFEEPPGSGLVYKEDGTPTEATVQKLVQKKREAELRAKAELEIQAQLKAEAAKATPKVAPNKEGK